MSEKTGQANKAVNKEKQEIGKAKTKANNQHNRRSNT